MYSIWGYGLSAICLLSFLKTGSGGNRLTKFLAITSTLAGETMNSSSGRELISPSQTDAAPPSSPGKADNPGSVLSIEGPAIEHQHRLHGLRQCICELLIRNQQLRMALMEMKAGEAQKERALNS